MRERRVRLQRRMIWQRTWTPAPLSVRFVVGAAGMFVCLKIPVAHVRALTTDKYEASLSIPRSL